MSEEYTIPDIIQQARQRKIPLDGVFVLASEANAERDALQAKLDKAMVGVREEKTFFDTCMGCDIVLFCEDEDSHNDVDGILCDECYRSCLDDGSVEVDE